MMASNGWRHAQHDRCVAKTVSVSLNAPRAKVWPHQARLGECRDCMEGGGRISTAEATVQPVGWNQAPACIYKWVYLEV